MQRFKNLSSLTGLVVFAIAFIVYAMTAEPTGSLWDCGEFILGAQKLQVVHPPGAPLFLLVGRVFTLVAETISSNPENIAFSINLLSGLCTALAAMFIALTTIRLAKLTLVEREVSTEDNDTSLVGSTLSKGQDLAVNGAGLVAGLTTAFCASIWFSAVEGEVYAMSTFFTALCFWSAVKWYALPDVPKSDRWLVFTMYMIGLSTGVHLLSLLTLPALGLLFYFKKNENHSLIGGGIGLIAGAVMIGFIQKVIIVGIPTLWKNFEIFCVNSLGLPFHSGLIPTLLIITALMFVILKYAHVKNKYLIQLAAVSTIMMMIGFSTIGVVVIRANADTPINMNVPSDALRLLPYINREQYGERPLLYGPHFDAEPSEVNKEKRYGRVGDKYEYVDEKYSYEYKAKDKMLLPRVSHSDPARKQLYREWWGQEKGDPGMGFNLKFMMQYQVGWMYWRYFMWNFAGKQNGKQGYNPWDKSDGHWLSGITPIDEARLYSMDKMPTSMKEDQSMNKYYLLPLIFGLLGLFFHAKNRSKEFMAVMVLFLITGLGIIMYSNSPPNEPRERDYVLVGSFMAFSIWVGMGVLAMFKLFVGRFNLHKVSAAGAATLMAITAPMIMAFQNYDDLSRHDQYGARDYASNFLESCKPNSIIFTYGDNDTYPLWYAQEVEGVRTDVRVVNLSLIAVDWYIDKLRSKVNDSPPLKLTLPSEAYRGNKRNQVFFYNPSAGNSPEAQNASLSKPISLFDELRFIGSPNNEMQGQTIMRSRNLYLPIDKNAVLQRGIVDIADTAQLTEIIPIRFNPNKNYILKDDLAVMDVIASNFYDRPIYFATTCKNDKLLGMNDYMQFEGLALRLIPVRSESDMSISIYGSGRMATDIVYDNVMNKFKWGNFDTQKTYISDSYGAEVQSHRMIMMRTGEQMLQEGKKQQAVAISKKYFDSFPHENFPYSPYVIPLIEVLVQGGDKEEAKKHMRILSNEIVEYLDFFTDIGPDVVNSSFRLEYLYDLQGVDELLTLAKSMKDPDFEKEMKDLLSPYKANEMSN